MLAAGNTIWSQIDGLRLTCRAAVLLGLGSVRQINNDLCGFWLGNRIGRPEGTLIVITEIHMRTVLTHGPL